MKFTGIKLYLCMALLAIALFSCAGVWWGYANLTDLVQARLKVLVGSDTSVGKAAARWNRIELDQVRIASSLHP